MGMCPPNSCATEPIGMEKNSACMDDESMRDMLPQPKHGDAPHHEHASDMTSHMTDMHTGMFMEGNTLHITGQGGRAHFVLKQLMFTSLLILTLCVLLPQDLLWRLFDSVKA